MGGKVTREYDDKNMDGSMSHVVEYRIYPKK
jgi:hypothetical protein